MSNKIKNKILFLNKRDQLITMNCLNKIILCSKGKIANFLRISVICNIKFPILHKEIKTILESIF